MNATGSPTSETATSILPGLNAHVAAAVARHSRRGWRIDQAERGENIDATVSMAMAVSVASALPEPVTLIGWI